MGPGPEGGQGRLEPEAIIEQSIEEGLREVLGESGLQMVLSHYRLDRSSTDPEEFHQVLKGIFMENGAAIIEREIARRLLYKIGNGRAGEGRLHRWWLSIAKSNANAVGLASAKEKRVLRQFMALASLPNGNPAGLKLEATRGRTRARS